MFIQEVHVKHFRSVVDETLPCDSLTALVGKNGSGKSSFLSALELFYEQSAIVTVEDFYNEDTTEDIEIAVTFGNLTPEASTHFSSYVDHGTLTIVRVFTVNGDRISTAYHGMRLQNPDFEQVRKAGGAREIINAYASLKTRAEYSALPTARSADAVRQAMDAWEADNPDQCQRMQDEGQFFGFRQVAQGYLGRYTRFISIPAVRNAQTDATEGRGSSVTQLMDLVVRNVLANREDVVEFRREVQERYSTIMSPSNLAELGNLAATLSLTLQSYVPEAGVILNWSQIPEINVPMPQAEVKLLEDEHVAAVERTGHGLQRAFIVTMLQHLVAAQRPDSSREDAESDQDDSVEGDGERRSALSPNLVLAVEEPELYQHPSRQRHLASVFMKLASGGIQGVAESTQVIYTTHSPLFAGLDIFDHIRVLHKVTLEEGKPRVTKVRRANLEVVSEELGRANNAPPEDYRSQTMRPRLHAIMTPWMGEGFFADAVVLVEGEEDRAAILGLAETKAYDLDGMGIAVIPCFGKRNLDRPLIIFRTIGIPTFVVWDGDKSSSDRRPEDNRYLMRLLSKTEEDWPCFISDTAACFEENLERTLEAEIGHDSFAELLSNAQAEFGITRRDRALKNPVVIRRVVQEAAAQGNLCPSLEQIVENVVALKSASASPP